MIIFNPKYLIPGYGGKLSLEEYEYIAQQLAIDASLRRKWGFRKRKKYPLLQIAEKCYPESPEEARKWVLSQIRVRKNHQNGFSKEYYKKTK